MTTNEFQAPYPYGSTVQIVTKQGTPVGDPVPAYVGRQETVRRSGQFAIDIIDRSSARCIVAPSVLDTYSPDSHNLRWNGKTYYPDGSPMITERNGRPYFATIPVRAIGT